MESPFATGTLYTFLLSGTNEVLLETTDVGELNKLTAPGFENDPITDGYVVVINGRQYIVNNILIYPKALSQLRQPGTMQVGQNHPYSVQIFLYVDE